LYILREQSKHNSGNTVYSVVFIQFAFLAFLAVYGTLIVTRFYHRPFDDQRPGRLLEIVVVMYVGGLAVEEMMQVSSSFAINFEF